MLPHNYLNFDLTGRKTLLTDHGDASGTGYYNTRTREYDRELLEMYLGHDAELPQLASPNQPIGQTRSGALVGPGTGDNMAASLGLDLQPGDVCISIGTSGVASTVSTASVHDGTGMVTGFADATGRYLPLACTLNGAKVLDFAARILNVDHNGLSALALEGEPGAHGISLLPYFDGERTPNRPDATGVFRGLTTDTSREDIARATVEGIHVLHARRHGRPRGRHKTRNQPRPPHRRRCQERSHPPHRPRHLRCRRACPRARRVRGHGRRPPSRLGALPTSPPTPPGPHKAPPNTTKPTPTPTPSPATRSCGIRRRGGRPYTYAFSNQHPLIVQQTENQLDLQRIIRTRMLRRELSANAMCVGVRNVCFQQGNNAPWPLRVDHCWLVFFLSSWWIN
ncbi:carbohydrate kinase, FGGY family protein [Corynebacterium glucuronolyticum ATCC 51866]|uniref:Carbohydrate kinase, FGGY family protein n=1 Tax=Corynebacterium glucuronolyticum ATCC 51866 TaxID=548478 RepID=A0ABP2DW63_9CORY|nr:carbohydrate kinase, FGGY family protein [Corynebacterium glucuronolyticum ATCC 51866]